MEMVRGPGSALYGANAYSGVINITTPTARDVLGTKITAAGGELSTIRGDVRHAGISPDGRLGYRFNFGYNRSDSWTQSRTALNGSDALAEYRTATDDPVTLSVEAIPLSGQVRDPTSGVATGDPLLHHTRRGPEQRQVFLRDLSRAAQENSTRPIHPRIHRMRLDQALESFALPIPPPAVCDPVICCQKPQSSGGSV